MTPDHILPPPDKTDIEIEIASLFRNGDIKNIARCVQRDAGLVSKMLSANCGDKNNIVYLGLLFIWAFDSTRRELFVFKLMHEQALRFRDQWIGENVPIEMTAEESKMMRVAFADYIEQIQGHITHQRKVTGQDI